MYRLVQKIDGIIIYLIFVLIQPNVVLLEMTPLFKDKMKAMLADERVYKKLKLDPPRGYKKKPVALLTGLKDQGKISLDQYRDLYPTSDLVPRLYASPKIHKKGNPLCLIIDYMGSMADTTSEAIANLHKPLVGKTIPC